MKGYCRKHNYPLNVFGGCLECDKEKEETRIFLAGPFFNTECRKELAALIKVLEFEEHKVFCAMRDGALVPTDAPKEIRQKYFKLDYAKIRWCNCMVAMLDYPLEHNQQLLLEITPKLDTFHRVYTPIYLPDMGAVFEIGCAYTLHKPVIGFTKQINSLNLMLSECCITVVSSYHDLIKAINALFNKNEIDFVTLDKMNVTNQKELFRL